MDPFRDLDWPEVLDHYERRVKIHRKILSLFDRPSPLGFAELLLGISDRRGNYSAAEHNLGPMILASNGRGAEEAANRVHDLAGEFLAVKSPHDVPRLIQNAGLQYLKIGVGSEASCMMNPQRCWVANTRTVWTHLLIKHDDDINKANEALKYYRDDDPVSEMSYAIWEAIHRELDTAMTRIAERAEKASNSHAVRPGPIKYLWADAVADALYGVHHA